MSRQERLSFVAEEEGLRLDRFLTERLGRYQRAFVRGLIERGLATVDGRAAEPARRLKTGERVEVRLPRGEWEGAARLDDRVLWEDSSLLVLDKPAGLLMHPLGESWLSGPEAALAEAEPSLAALLQRERPAILRAGTPRCGIVHRLDRPTSGVLLVAKTPEAHGALVAAFKERAVRKVYRAVVRGVPALGPSRVKAPVGRKPGHRRVLVTPFGKEAETGFKVLEAGRGAAVVEARPLTGRTHQIRAHLAFLGHPVAGDPEFDRGGVPAPPRLMLHAYSVGFAHPRTGKPVEFKAPLPEDFRAFWRLCRSGAGSP